MGETQVVPVEKKLRIGWSWASEDGWLLHRTIKDELWVMLNSDKIDVKTLLSILKIKEDWLEIRETDKIPINYKMLLYFGKYYMGNYRKMNPPILYRLGIKKITILFLTLFREDSAYCERIGGICQYIIDHPEDWPEGDKEARLLALQDLRQWWIDEDWRARGKDKLLKIFDWVIEHYESEEFVRKSVDYWVDSLIKNKDKWNRGINEDTKRSYFDPISWYPRGKGQVNYLCHGRMS